MQDPPELFPDIYDSWKKNNCNVVYCVRKSVWAKLYLNELLKIILSIIKSLSDINIPNDTGDFRLIDKSVIDAFKLISEKINTLEEFLVGLALNMFLFIM